MTMDFREDAYGEKMKDRLGWTLQAPERWRLSDVLWSAAFGLVVFVLLTGCAQLAQPVQGVCAFQPIGENEEGVQFFRYHCKPRE